MRVIRVKELPSDRVVRCPDGGFISNRILLGKDGMGFTMTSTVIPKGDAQHWHYKNHLEACYCIVGNGTLTDLTTGLEYEISPGTVYALDRNEPHLFQAHETVILVCVFNPPLTGNEVHGNDRSYEIKEFANG